MGYWRPLTKIPPKLVTLPAVLRFLTPSPPVLKHFTPPMTRNKKHEDVKLMHKPLIPHDLTNKKNKVQSEEIQ